MKTKKFLFTRFFIIILIAVVANISPPIGVSARDTKTPINKKANEVLNITKQSNQRLIEKIVTQFASPL